MTKSLGATTHQPVRYASSGVKAAKRSASVSKVRVRTATGDTVINYSIDANSETFANDFLYVFTKNVEKARSGGQKKAAKQKISRKKKP